MVTIQEARQQLETRRSDIEEAQRELQSQQFELPQQTLRRTPREQLQKISQQFSQSKSAIAQEYETELAKQRETEMDFEKASQDYESQLNQYNALVTKRDEYLLGARLAKEGKGEAVIGASKTIREGYTDYLKGVDDAKEQAMQKQMD